jgi:hypothetical protein
VAETFQRLNGPPSSLDPKQYTVLTETGRPALCCPACSHVFDLPYGIVCDIVGKTNHCVTCPALSCGWWSYAVLDSIWEDM